MSTRCQIKVVDGPDHPRWDTNVTLYHHCDGYPSNMLELIGKAWGYANRISIFWPGFDITNGNPFDYQLNRPGYVGSFLCNTDPHGFQLESGHELHGDIEWYYVINVNIQQKSEEWKIFLYKTKIKMEGGPDLQLVMEGRISDFLTRKNKIRKEVALHIKKETEGSYIGTKIAGERV